MCALNKNSRFLTRRCAAVRNDSSLWLVMLVESGAITGDDPALAEPAAC